MNNINNNNNNSNTRRNNNRHRLIEQENIEQENNIKIGYINAGGLKGKLAEIQDFMMEENIYWMWVTETQMERRNKDPYNTYSNIIGKEYRHGRASYGSIILINPELKEEIDKTPFEIVEIGQYGWYQCFRWRGCLYLGVYMTPVTNGEGISDEEWIGIIEKCQRHRNRNEEPFIIIGDFNMRMGSMCGDNATNRRANTLGRWLRENGFRFQCGQADENGLTYTFRNQQGYSYIDHCFYTGEITMSAPNIHYHSIRTEHNPISMVVNIPRFQKPRMVKYMKWKLYKLQKGEVREQLASNFQDKYMRSLMEKVRNTQVQSQEEVDNLYEAISKDIIQNGMEVIGIVKVVKGKPYVTSQRLKEINRHYRNMSILIDSMGGLNRCPRRYREALEDLKLVRKDAQEEAESMIAEGWREFVNKLDKGEGFILMKSMKGFTNNRIRSRSNLLKPSMLAEYAIKFEIQFSPVEECTPYSPPPVKQGTYEQQQWISKEDVSKALRISANGKAPGITGLRMELLKYCEPHLSGVLAEFFNKVIASGYIPSCWREARIIPIPKKNISADINDHRPISLTETMRKVFERCILPFLTNAIEPLDIGQGGFRHRRGTTDTVAALNESIIQFEREKGDSPVIAFLDIKAAYDSVHHDRLWTLLESTNLNKPMTRIIRNLFTGIRSRVAVLGQESQPFMHRAGVLQGSILSPSLYSLYINEAAIMAKNMRPDFRTIFLYADDIAIMADNSRQMGEIVGALEQHSFRANYRFNPGKCEVMNSESELLIYGQAIPPCESFKYLGIWMDIDGIDWMKHTKHVAEKTRKMLHFFIGAGYNSSGFRERTRLTIFKTFLRSRYDYGLCIMPDTKKYRKELELVQNECLRALFSVGKTTATLNLHVITGVPMVEDRHKELAFRNHRAMMTKNSTFMVTATMEKSRGQFSKRRSCMAFLMNNPLNGDHNFFVELNKQNQRQSLDRRMENWTEEDGIRLGANSRIKDWTEEDTILAIRKKRMIEMREQAGLTEAIPIYDDCKPRFLYGMSRSREKVARLCTLYILRKIPGRPSLCNRCGNSHGNLEGFKRCIGMEENVDHRLYEGAYTTAATLIQEIMAEVENLQQARVMLMPDEI